MRITFSDTDQRSGHALYWPIRPDITSGYSARLSSRSGIPRFAFVRTTSDDPRNVSLISRRPRAEVKEICQIAQCLEAVANGLNRRNVTPAAHSSDDLCK